MSLLCYIKYVCNNICNRAEVRMLVSYLFIKLTERRMLFVKTNTFSFNIGLSHAESDFVTGKTYLFLFVWIEFNAVSAIF